jgi:hypothetical protein
MFYLKILSFLCGLLFCTLSFNVLAENYCSSPTAHVRELRALSTPTNRNASCNNSTAHYCEVATNPIYFQPALGLLCHMALQDTYCPTGSNMTDGLCVCKKGTNWEKIQQACR